jgi:predicted site-specific integrase-resolvase
VPFCLNSRVFAKKLGLSVKTLQRWDVSGKLPAKRTLSGHRFYTEDDLLIANGLKPIEANRCFSCRLYGLRNYSKEIKESLKNAIDKPVQDLADLSNQEIQC